MSTKINNFIAEIVGNPKFAAAAAQDPVWSAHFEAIELGLTEIDRRANDDPAMIEIFDKVVSVISDENRTLKQRLLDLVATLTPLHDRIKGVLH